MAGHMLENADDISVVIGPVVRATVEDEPDYFMVATSGDGRGFRCDQISIGNGFDGVTIRAGLVMALLRRKSVVIHDMGDELVMARFCEMLWPGERITKLRESIETERAVKH
jgi:hypothetical protein